MCFAWDLQMTNAASRCEYGWGKSGIKISTKFKHIRFIIPNRYPYNHLLSQLKSPTSLIRCSYRSLSEINRVALCSSPSTASLYPSNTVIKTEYNSRVHKTPYPTQSREKGYGQGPNLIDEDDVKCHNILYKYR